MDSREYIRVLLCSLGIIFSVFYCVVWPIEGIDAGLSMTVDDTDDEMEFTSLSSNPMLRRKWLGSDLNTITRALRSTFPYLCLLNIIFWKARFVLRGAPSLLVGVSCKLFVEMDSIVVMW